MLKNFLTTVLHETRVHGSIRMRTRFRRSSGLLEPEGDDDDDDDEEAHTHGRARSRRSTLHHDDTAEQTAKLTAPLSLRLRTAGPADDSRREECHGPPGGRAGVCTAAAGGR